MKFLHTADWLIGKPFVGIRDERKRALTQNSRLEAIKRIGDIARREGSEFVVVAGDLFDSPSADKSTVSAACSAIGQLRMPVFAIPGNHDHGGPGNLWEQDFFIRERDALAQNLIVLLEASPYETDSAVFLPCPLLRRSVAGDPTAWLRDSRVYAGLSPDKPRIVIAHGSTPCFSSPWVDGKVAARFSTARDQIFIRGGSPRSGSDLDRSRSEQDEAKAVRNRAEERLGRLRQAMSDYENADAAHTRPVSDLAGLRQRRQSLDETLSRVNELRDAEREHRAAVSSTSDKLHSLQEADRRISDVRSRIASLQEALEPTGEATKGKK
jgi:hypothetical protein